MAASASDDLRLAFGYRSAGDSLPLWEFWDDASAARSRFAFPIALRTLAINNGGSWEAEHARQAAKSFSASQAKERSMKGQTTKRKSKRAPRQEFPKGWDQARIKMVLDHYEGQTEEEAAAEDESAYLAKDQTVMIVPSALVPTIRQLIAKRRSA